MPGDAREKAKDKKAAIKERYDKKAWNYSKEGEVWDALKELEARIAALEKGGK